MNQSHPSANRKKAIERYILALDTGNLDEIIAVIGIAENDAELDRIISEINSSYAEELRLIPTTEDVQVVRNLIRKHLPSAFEEANIDTPITVSQVAARLFSERAILQPDQETGRKMLNIHIALPDWLGISEVRKLGDRLRLKASDRFWKTFREAAIQMSMGNGQAQMAAARRKNSRQQSVRSKNKTEDNHGSS